MIPIICDGNSITEADYGGFTPYPETLSAIIVDDFVVTNVGVGGQQTPTMTSLVATHLATTAPRRAPKVVVAFELTNHINGVAADGATAAAAWAEYVAAARALDFEVWTCTCPPVDQPGSSRADQQGDVDDANALLLANEGGIYGDIIIDLSTMTDSALYLENDFHPNGDGLAEIASRVAAATVSRRLELVEERRQLVSSSNTFRIYMAEILAGVRSSI